MIDDWLDYYNAQEETFRWDHLKLHKYMCRLDNWWARKGYFEYKQEQAIDKIYHSFKLHLKYANGWDSRSTITRKMA